MAKTPTPAELLPGLNYKPPEKGWMDVKPDFRPGTYCNAANPKWMEWINYPYPGAWSVKPTKIGNCPRIGRKSSCRAWKTG